MDLRKESMVYRKHLNQISHKELKRAYLLLCELLESVHKSEMSRTASEDAVYNLIKQSTKLQVFRSFWIGKRNIDLFIPAIRANLNSGFTSSQGFKGLAIEIDGKIHDRYFKMKKDENKYEMLKELSICTVTIENHDINNPIVINMIQNLAKIKKVDSRAKSRLLRNIYLKTITCNKSLIVEHKLPTSTCILRLLGEL
ncbi:MAG: hypothetical protein PHY93_18855 [Bacteriovorax sp.]|nr:hypothetical protein [Bacteriovorax sp.]